MTLLYGAGVLILVWWLSKVFTRANPAAMAKALRLVGGVAALGGAAILALRGRIDMAFLLGGVASWLLGWQALSFANFGRSARKSAGAVSRVRSAMIEMELDHDTGSMEGTVLAGEFAGRALRDLDEAALIRLVGKCLRSDPDGARLLEAYLDRRMPGWREHADRDAHPRSGGVPQPGAMSEQEAYEILGLRPGAGADEVRTAHRTLMKKLHPDQGGSTYLAARVNQAKEVLLGRHR
ncbi:MAG TPA: DnaJ domain-containing protein [Beijerinckiaceae bacterium]|jgi:hypothetical protein